MLTRPGPAARPRPQAHASTAVRVSVVHADPPAAAPIPPRAVAEWAAFGTTVAAMAVAARGTWVTAGPLLLFVAALAMLPVAYRAGAATGGQLAVRLAALAVAAGGVRLVAGLPPPFELWLGRAALLGGLLFAALDATPAAVRAALRGLFDRLTAHPNGLATHAFAGLAVGVPAAALFLSTSVIPFSGDTLPVVATIVRTLEAGDRDLSEYADSPREGRWRAFVGQDPPYNMHPSGYAPGKYSAYPAGMEVFAWPRVLLAWAAGDDLRDDEVQCRIEFETAAAVAATALTLFFLTAVHLADAAAAFAVTLALATGSVFFTTFGQLLWQQGGVAFWIVVVLLVEVKTRGRPGWVGTVVQGVACGLMLACRPSAATFLLPFGVWVLVRDWRRGLVVPAVAAAAYAPFAVVYWELHRTVVGPSAGLAAGFTGPSATVFWGLLASPGRGLFVYQPVLLLVPLAAFTRFRSEAAGRLGLYPFVAAFAGLHCLLVSGWVMWWGGHCLGSRLVGEVVPAAALLAVPVAARVLGRPGGWVAVGLLVFAGLMAHHTGAYHNAIRWNASPVDVDAVPKRVWSWKWPPFLFAGGHR